MSRLKPILVAGLLLRVVVYLVLDPSNNDPHIPIVFWILDHGFPPASDQSPMGFHPPLYYMMAAPFALLGKVKAVQFLSLVFSLANLWFIYRFIRETRLLGEGARLHAMALAASLPQFVIFGNFVSNDSLSFLIGSLCFIQAFRYIERPVNRELFLLALALGAGLLTKGTFLAFVPILGAVVLLKEMSGEKKTSARITAVVLFCLVTVVVGGYKFAENTWRMGTPVVHGLDLEPPWMAEQQGTYQGPGTLLDVNVLKLVREPFLSESTRHSYPLLLYGTFWQPYILESNLVATRNGGLTFVSRVVYLAGLPVTALILLGLGGGVMKALRVEGLDSVSGQQRLTGILLFFFNLALVVTAGVRYDVWSCFQGRLLFPSAVGIALSLGWGVETVSQSLPGSARFLNGLLAGVYLLLGGYLLIETGVALAA